MRWGLILLTAMACSGADRDPDAVLARARAMVRAHTARVSNYTCVQTIQRLFLAPKGGLGGKPLQSCRELAALKSQPKLIQTHTDRFRVEVRVGTDQEMYSWVDSPHFSDLPLRELMGSGSSSSGALGPLLVDLFEDAPRFRFDGEQAAHGRQVLAYSFQVPAERSNHDFVLPDGSVVPIAYHGSILIEPETGLPVQLNVLAGELPSLSRCCGFNIALDFQLADIGAEQFLLPVEARQSFALASGGVEENSVTFSACRAYGADSKVSFGEAAASRTASARAPFAGFAEGQAVTIALEHAIKGSLAVAGDPITGRIEEPLLDKAKNPIAPAGALVKGHIVRADQWLQLPTRMTITLQMESVEIGGVAVPLQLVSKSSINLQRDVKAAYARSGLPIGELPPLRVNGRTSITCDGTCDLRQGTRSHWVTGGSQ